MVLAVVVVFLSAEGANIAENNGFVINLGQNPSINYSLNSVAIPTALKLYYVEDIGLASVLTSLGLPATQLLYVSTNNLNSTLNQSIIVFDYSTLAEANVSSNVLSSLFQKGDLISVYTQNFNESVETLNSLGIAWANAYHSKILVIPAVPIPDSAVYVMAYGGSHSLAISPVQDSISAFSTRVNSWYEIAQDPPNNSDPVVYTQQTYGSYGTTFLTGETEGYHDVNGTYYYDLGIFVENTYYPSGTGYYEIPVTTIAWLEYLPSSTMTGNDGSIGYLNSNLSQSSSYYDYVHGPPSGSNPNSYIYSTQGTSPSSTSGGTTSYSSSFTFPDESFSFGITYTPPQGNEQVAFQGKGLQGTPYPEDYYLWNFTYTTTVANDYYTNGYTGTGEWLLLAGTSNYNSAYLTETQNVSLITKLTLGYHSETYYYERIYLNLLFNIEYYPGSNWSVTGTHKVLGAGSVNGYPVSEVYHWTYTRIS